MAAHTAYFCLGGNLGERLSNLEETRMFVSFNMGDITAESPIYETAAWGMENAPAFLNQVIKVTTELTVAEVMTEIAELDEFFGRTRKANTYLDREMDVDLLFYDDLILQEEKIELPHPRLHLRRFVLQPLADIDPEMMHPLLKKNIAQLLADCEDAGQVKKV